MAMRPSRALFKGARVVQKGRSNTHSQQTPAAHAQQSSTTPLKSKLPLPVSNKRAKAKRGTGSSTEHHPSQRLAGISKAVMRGTASNTEVQANEVTGSTCAAVEHSSGGDRQLSRSNTTRTNKFSSKAKMETLHSGSNARFPKST